MNNMLFNSAAAVFLTIVSAATAANYSCQLRAASYGNICVCNGTYCDTVPDLEDLSAGQYQLYTTSKINLGFWSSVSTFSNGSGQNDNIIITVANKSATHQTIYGFGGAFTDATGINVARLSEEAQELFLQSYYGEEGIQYSFVRLPIGGTDFSTRGYTYCDVNDTTLNSFALQEEDLLYKIPYVQRALELRGAENLKLFASAWSAPPWMKTNNNYNGFGKILDKYYGLWAQYYLKFFDAYKNHNLTFWGVTTQNEPIDGLLGLSIPSNGFTATDMVTWVKDYLGPAIRGSDDYSALKIILHDDQRVLLANLKYGVLSNSEVVNYADGIGIHWYTDKFTPPQLLELASSDDKDLFRLATEACEGSLAKSGLEKAVELGSWARAESYFNNIIQDLSYDFVGWVDWNMALNESGGPDWIDNQVDSPVIVNGTANEFYKQPMFYILGHFSKFISTGSVRIDVSVSQPLLTSYVKATAFLRPDNKVAVVLFNSSDDELTVTVNILGVAGNVVLQANSINTLLTPAS